MYKKIAVTGHRNINNEYNGTGPVSDALRVEFNNIFNKYSPNQAITGMALGVDQLFAEEAIKNVISVVAAIPCKGHDSRWPHHSKDRYHGILNNFLTESHLVYDGGYAPWVMQKRNEWMVDRADLLVAVYDGVSQSGTLNCINYCRRQGKPIHLVNLTGILSSLNLK